MRTDSQGACLRATNMEFRRTTPPSAVPCVYMRELVCNPTAYRERLHEEEEDYDPLTPGETHEVEAIGVDSDDPEFTPTLTEDPHISLGVIQKALDSTRFRQMSQRQQGGRRKRRLGEKCEFLAMHRAGGACPPRVAGEKLAGRTKHIAY